MSNVYKVTAASIGETKRGYKIYKLQLNNSIWATKLIPLSKLERKYNKLYQVYIENNNSLDFLIGKYISISMSQSQYGAEFSSISSFDVLQDFKNELDASEGEAFATHLPIYDFLSNIQRTKEADGSIKITSNFKDMRISKINGINVCCQYDKSFERLNLNNLEQIFNEFYKDIPLPAYAPGASESYYKLDMNEVAIVKMDHHIKVSTKMTTSGDYDKWIPKVIKKIGNKLQEEQVQFLKKSQ